VSAEVIKDVMTRVGLTIGDPVTDQTAKRFRDAAATVDEHLRVNFVNDGKGGLIVTVVLP